jgi:Mg-chelatase subunit ChlD
MNYNNDPDIPIAYGTMLPASTAPFVPIPPPRPNLQDAQHFMGRSSRINLPTEQDVRIPDASMKALEQQGYSRGLAESLWKTKRTFPLRIWIVDNSGSMNTTDGHRVVEMPKKNDMKLINCTRWAEMQQTVDYHAQLAALIKSPTVFRMLNDPGRVNGPQQFSIAERGDAYIDEDLAIATSVITNSSPGGVTPLVQHLSEVRANIVSLESELRQNGTKVAVIIATDGLPSNDQGISDNTVKRQFMEALRSLEGLPVWVVVKLCTDEDAVVDYYNDLDGQLELSLEVLDDFAGEAKEVHQFNKWLNYGLPLHRLREMGYHDRIFDLLDERMLSKDELREFFRILFGDTQMDGVPEPEADWKGFLAAVTTMVKKEKKQWNPLTKKMEPWFNTKQLKKDYGTGFFASLF